MFNDKNASSSDPQVLMNQIILEFMREQKRKRRWRLAGRILVFMLIAIVVFSIFSESADVVGSKSKPHVGLIDIQGGIFEQTAGSADTLVKGLSDAYKSTGLKALILRINSPGGSPVQADYMFNSIQFYRKKYPDVKIYAVCTDLCASAAYYAAAAADEIYASPSSMVGSIGVIYNGFGFVDLMQKLGISRRIQTAGSNKAILDPFLPERPEDKMYLQNMLHDVHQQFIDKVKAGRGTRLKIDDLTFSGLFWTGEEAKKRGLVDGFASSGELARKLVKDGTLIDYTHQENLFDKLSKNIGASMADHLPEAMGFRGRMVM